MRRTVCVFLFVVPLLTVNLFWQFVRKDVLKIVYPDLLVVCEFLKVVLCVNKFDSESKSAFFFF